MAKDREARPQSAKAWRPRVSAQEWSGDRCGDKIVPLRVRGAESLVDHKAPPLPSFF